MERTPKNYQGIMPPGKQLKDLLFDQMRKIQRNHEQKPEEIFKAWYEIIGPKMGPMTQPVAFIDGVLTVKVKSSTLYSLLCQYERPRLLRALTAKFPVRSIVFKIG